MFYYNLLHVVNHYSVAFYSIYYGFLLKQFIWLFQSLSCTSLLMLDFQLSYMLLKYVHQTGS